MWAVEGRVGWGDGAGSGVGVLSLLETVVLDVLGCQDGTGSRERRRDGRIDGVVGWRVGVGVSSRGRRGRTWWRRT